MGIIPGSLSCFFDDNLQKELSLIGKWRNYVIELVEVVHKLQKILDYLAYFLPANMLRCSAARHTSY